MDNNKNSEQEQKELDLIGNLVVMKKGPMIGKKLSKKTTKNNFETLNPFKIMVKKPMILLPRPSTKPGKQGGPAGNNPPKPKKK